MNSSTSMKVFKRKRDCFQPDLKLKRYWSRDGGSLGCPVPLCLSLPSRVKTPWHLAGSAPTLTPPLSGLIFAISTSVDIFLIFPLSFKS